MAELIRYRPPHSSDRVNGERGLTLLSASFFIGSFNHWLASSFIQLSIHCHRLTRLGRSLFFSFSLGHSCAGILTPWTRFFFFILCPFSVSCFLFLLADVLGPSPCIRAPLHSSAPLYSQRTVSDQLALYGFPPVIFFFTVPPSKKKMKLSYFLLLLCIGRAKKIERPPRMLTVTPLTLLAAI